MLSLRSVVPFILPGQSKTIVKSKPPLHPQVQPCLSFSFALLSFIEELKLLSTREVKTNFHHSNPILPFASLPALERRTLPPGTAQCSLPCCSVAWCLLPPGRVQGAQGLCSSPAPSRPNGYSLHPLLLLWYFHPEHPSFSTVSPGSSEEIPASCRPFPFSAHTISVQDSIPTIFLQLVLPRRNKLHNRQHILNGPCYTPSSFWFYMVLSVFWIKGRRVISLWFLAIFSASIRETVMPMIFHALAEHGCSRQELCFLNKKGR